MDPRSTDIFETQTLYHWLRETVCTRWLTMISIHERLKQTGEALVTTGLSLKDALTRAALHQDTVASPYSHDPPYRTTSTLPPTKNGYVALCKAYVPHAVDHANVWLFEPGKLRVTSAQLWAKSPIYLPKRFDSGLEFTTQYATSQRERE